MQISESVLAHCRHLEQELGQPQQLLIGGRWQEAVSGARFETYNPATGEVLARVARGESADIDLAVRAARDAFDNPAWRGMSPVDRSAMLMRLAELIERDAEQLAVLECLDQGKPVAQTMAVEVQGSIRTFRYFAGWPTKFGGETLPVTSRKASHLLNYTTREPVGVCGLIVPWNYPLSMAAWKVAPALAAGCTVVLKPAEQTPLTALRLGALALEAGIPEGVLNVVTGFGEAGAALVAHPGVDKVAFTGSTEVGKRIVAGAAGNLKKVSLELGGKSPHIIFPDADLQAAGVAAADGLFFNMGQTCTAGSRLYVHERCFDEVSEIVCRRAASLVLGNGLHQGVDSGPLVSQDQLDRVSDYVASGVGEGAQLIAGGGRPADLGAGYFHEPTVFMNGSEDHRIVREEIFGPILTMMTWCDVDELIARANDSSYGLAAGLWTNDLKTAHRVAGALQSGSVWVNCYDVIDPASPFGGFKQSGWGREHGRQAMELYSEVKSTWINLS
jgi:acyl-CoA reductase-like NAD-dependent aldehyde dehydrogenase